MVDANLLIYAFNPEDKLHKAARSWLETMLSGDDVLAVPMLAVSALLRAVTHPKLGHLERRMREAQQAIDSLSALPNVRLVHTDEHHWAELKRVLDESGVMGRTVTDAQFAALALQHHAMLYTTDQHFRKFPRLRWMNPLLNKPGTI